MIENIVGPTEAERRLLARILGEVPEGFSGLVRVYLPERPGEDAILTYDGKEFRFSERETE